MPSDVLITPASSKIDFTDGANSTKRLNISGTAFSFNSNLNVLSSTSLGSAFKAEGVNGTLFEVIDDLSNSLMSVNTIGGLPVFEVFANNSIIAGQYGVNDFVISGNKVGIGLANPINKLSISGSVSIGASYNVAAPSNGLIVQGSVGIGITNPTAKLDVAGGGLSVSGWSNNNSGSTGGVEIGWDGTQGIFQVYDRVNANYEPILINGSAIQFFISGGLKWTLTTAGVLQSNNAQTIQTSTGNLTLATAAGNGHIVLSPHGTGNVGIGTASPTQKLDVNGSARFANIVYAAKGIFSDASGVGGVIEAYNTVATNATTAIIRQTTAGGNGNQDIGLLVDIQGANDLDRIANFRYYDGSTYTSRMAIMRGGNVGIGTTSPVSLLTVGSTTTTTSSMTLQGEYQSSIFNNTNIFGFRHGGADRWRLTTNQNSASSNDFDFKINSLDSAATNYTTFVTIKGLTGNVGIGTISPSQALHILTSNSGNNGLTIATTSATGNPQIRFLNSAGVEKAAITYASSADAVYFYTAGSASNLMNFVGANVGIGNITPANKLAVSGSASIGSSYNVAAPTNGLIVEGSVGIGITNPADKLHVIGNIRINGGDILNWSGQAFIQTIGANDMFFRPNSTLRMILTTGGNLGLGNGFTNPLAKLHINSTTSGETLLRTDGTNGTLFSVVDDLSDSLMSVNNSAGLPVLEVFADDRVVMGQYGANDFVLRNNKIGVGTNNPNDQLTFAQVDDDAIQIRRRTVSQGGPATGTGISWTWTSATTDTETWAAIRAIFPGNSDSHLTFSTRNTSSVFGERMRIQNDGNVGVGTITPSARLQVGTNSTAVSADNSPIARFGGSGSGSRVYGLTLANTASAAISNDSSLSFIVAGNYSATGIISAVLRSTVTAATDLVFTNYNNALFERMRIQFDGNVGIGTSLPSSQLEVGNVNTSGSGITVSARYDQSEAYIRFRTGHPNNSNVWETANISATDGGNYNGTLSFRTAVSGQSSPSTKMTILPTGNVGINNTNPVFRLDVNGTSGFRDSMAFGPSVGLISWGSMGGGTGFGMRAESGRALSLGANGSFDHIVINTSGNVGVGTTGPIARLHVYDTNQSPATGNLLVTSTGGNASIRIDSSSISQYTYFTLSQGGTGRFELGIVPTSSDFYINPTVQSGANGAAIYVKKADGNVGINSTSPNSPLTVYNNSDVWHFRLGGASGELRMGGQTNSGAVIQAYTPGGSVRDLYLQRDGGNIGVGLNNPSGKIHIYENANRVTYLAQNNNHTARFEAYGTATAIDTTASNGIFFRINGGDIVKFAANGNVGIGTTGPATKLDVFGPISIRGTKVLSTGFDDFGGLAYDIYGNIRVLRSTSAQGDGMYIGYGGSGGPLRFFSNSGTTEFMTIATSGNIGINTTTPSRKLQVNGDVAFATNSGGLIIASYDGDTPNLRPSVANGSILISDDSGSVNRGTEFLNGGGIVIQSLSGFTPLDVRSNSASLLFVTSAGNVGIGTTVPTAYAGYTSLTIGNPNSTGLIKLRSAYSSGNGAEIYQTGSGHLLLNINSSLTSMYLKVDGNVGVGTVNPLSKLAVDGVTSVGPSSKLSLIGLDINSGATPTYIKIVTTIPVASPSADFTVNIKGFVYGAIRNADISISWHYYLSTFYNPIAKSSGGWAPTIRLSAEGGFVAIVLSSPGYWPKFYVESMYSSAYSNQYSTGWSWVDADATGSPIVNVPYASNFGNNFVMLTDGNVGVGTASPSQILDVRGNIKLGADNSGNYIYYVTDIERTIIRTARSDVSQVGLFRSDGWGNFTVDKSIGIGYSLGSNFASSTIGNGNLYVAGNVGIGTTAPAALLQIGTGTPVATTGGIQFGGDTSARLYRSAPGIITCSGTIAATFSGNLTGNATNVTGVVALANGGSGQNSAQAAMNAFAGAVTSGSYLRGNGTNVVMSTIQAADVPTLNQNTTGSSTFVASLGVLNYDNDRTTKRAGLSHYTGYSTGTNRPTTYDYTLQVTNGTSGWEISMDWIATTGPAIYARSLRDCCQNWSSWVRILDSANYSFAANMNQNVRTTDGVTFAGITGNGQLNINHSTPTAVARLWSGGSTVWSLGVGDASGSYFNISADFGSFTINKTNGYVGIGTTSQTTRLQLGSGTPTASADGIQFGGDTSARIYRSSSAVVSVSNSFAAANGYIYASNYLQTGNNLIYPAGFSSTQRLAVGNAAQNNWIDGLTLAPGGNVVIAGTLTESSSIRYKENIETISAPILPKLNKIRPVTYNKKDNPKHIEYGIIAEELNELFPEFVNKNESGEVESVNYSRLTVILIKAVKELQEEVEKLKNK